MKISERKNIIAYFDLATSMFEGLPVNAFPDQVFRHLPKILFLKYQNINAIEKINVHNYTQSLELTYITGAACISYT